MCVQRRRQGYLWGAGNTKGVPLMSFPNLLILQGLLLLYLIQNIVTEFIIVHKIHRADDHFAQQINVVVYLSFCTTRYMCYIRSSRDQAHLLAVLPNCFLFSYVKYLNSLNFPLQLNVVSVVKLRDWLDFMFQITSLCTYTSLAHYANPETLKKR